MKKGMVLPAGLCFDSTFMCRSVVSSYASGGRIIGEEICVAGMIAVNVPWERWAARPFRARGESPQPCEQDCVIAIFAPRMVNSRRTAQSHNTLAGHRC